MIRAVGLTLVVALVTVAWASSAQALSLQTVGTFGKPIYVTSDPGNPERLFVVEREGSIDLVQGSEIRLFADISPLVSTAGEGGLLSIALPPDFDQSGRLYLDYVGKEGSIHIAEMVASNSFAPASTLDNLLTIPTPKTATTTVVSCRSGPKATFSSPPATAAAATTNTTTPRTPAACWASSCG